MISGYSAQNQRVTRCLETFASVTPIMSANAQCIDGTAAYGLKSALTLSSFSTFANSLTVSMKLYSAKKNRGGAVG